MQLRFSLKGRLKLTAALRLQMGMSPQSNLLHCQQTLTSRLTLLLWACWRLSLGCKKHLGSSIPKVPLSLCEKETGKHEPAHTHWSKGGPYVCPCGRGCYLFWNGNVEQMAICPSLATLPRVYSPPASKRYAKGSRWKSLSLSQVFLYRTVLFPNRAYSPLFHRRILVNQNKKGLSSFELLLSLLNV